MAMGAVLGGWGVSGVLLEGLAVDVMLGSKGLQHGIETLPRPSQ
jgi:hypothetical protein